MMQKNNNNAAMTQTSPPPAETAYQVGHLLGQPGGRLLIGQAEDERVDLLWVHGDPDLDLI